MAEMKKMTIFLTSCFLVTSFIHIYFLSDEKDKTSAK